MTSEAKDNESPWWLAAKLFSITAVMFAFASEFAA